MELARAAAQHRERMNGAAAGVAQAALQGASPDSQPCASAVPCLQLPRVRPRRGQARVRRGGRTPGRAARRTARIDIDRRKLCRLDDGVFSHDEQVIVSEAERAPRSRVCGARRGLRTQAFAIAMC